MFNYIDYSFAQYLDLLAKRSTNEPLPGLQLGELPTSYIFRTQATLDNLEKMVLENGFFLDKDIELFRLYEHQSAPVNGYIPFPESDNRYGRMLTVDEDHEFESRIVVPSSVPVIIYNSAFKYQCIEGEQDYGKKLEAVATITEALMKTILTRQIPAFWQIRVPQQLPLIVGNLTSLGRCINLSS